jgi:hypothetical protein
MSGKELSPLSPLELHPLLHPTLEIRLKIIFILKISFLQVGVNFARNTMEKSRVRLIRVPKIRSLGNRELESIIVVLDLVDPKDVMFINSINKSYAPKGKFDPPCSSSRPSTSSPTTSVQGPKVPDSKEQLILFPLMNKIS